MTAVHAIDIDQAAEDAAFVAAIKAAADQEADPAIREWLRKFVAEVKSSNRTEQP